MPIIAISREAFSGGEALAKAAAERLGYECIGQEATLQLAVKEYGIPAEGLRAAMEKRPSFLDRVAGQHTVNLKYVRAAFCEQVRVGKVVYHGQLEHLLLPGIGHVIGVRVIADLESRIQAVQQEQHLTQEAARVLIEKIEKDRRRWARFRFDVEWGDPHPHDVVLNLSRMTLDSGCDVVIRLAERPEFQPTPASLRAMENLALQSRVGAALAKSFRNRSADLAVTAEDGVVTISGLTRWPEVETAVSMVARQVDGVKEVRTNVIRYAPTPRSQ